MAQWLRVTPPGVMGGFQRALFAAAAMSAIVAIGAPLMAPDAPLLARVAQPLTTALLALAAVTARPALAPGTGCS